MTEVGDPKFRMDERDVKSKEQNSVDNLLHSGLLEKRSHFRGAWKLRWLELNDNTLSTFTFPEGIKGEKKSVYSLTRFSEIVLENEELEETFGVSIISVAPDTQARKTHVNPRISLCADYPSKTFFTIKNIKVNSSVVLDSSLNVCADTIENAMIWMNKIQECITHEIYKYMSSKYLLSDVLGNYNTAVKFPIELHFGGTSATTTTIPGLHPNEDYLLNSIEILGPLAPTITCTPLNSLFPTSFPNGFFTILIVNPDFKWKGGDTKDHFIQYLASNCTTSPDKHVFGNENVICDYVAPCPTFNSGTNRVVVIVFQQQDKLTVEKLALAERNVSRFSGFQTQNLYFNLGLSSVVALNCFNCAWEPYVDSTLDSIGLSPHPNYKASKEDTVEMSGAQFLKVLSSMRRAESKAEYLEQVVTNEKAFKKIAHEQFQEYSARVDEERYRTRLDVDLLTEQAATSSRNLELTEANLSRLQRLTSDSTLETAKEVERLIEENKKLTRNIAGYSKTNEQILNIIQSEIDKNPWLKSTIKKQGYGAEEIFGSNAVQDLKFTVDYLIKQAKEKTSKIDTMLLDQAKLKIQLEDAEKAKKKILDSITDLNNRIKSLESENNLLRNSTTNKEGDYLAEMDKANAQIRELQHLLREEKMTSDRLHTIHAEKQRTVQSISSDSVRLREKYTENIARLTLKHESDVKELKKQIDDKTAEISNLASQVETETQNKAKLANDRESEKDISAKLRSTLKTQETLTVKKENELTKLTAELTKTRTELATMKSLYEKSVQENAENKTQVNAEKEAVTKVQSNVTELEAMLTKRDSDVSLAFSELSKAKTDIAERDEVIATRDKQSEVLKVEISSIKAVADKATGQVSVLNDKIENLKTELMVLNSKRKEDAVVKSELEGTIVELAKKNLELDNLLKGK